MPKKFSKRPVMTPQIRPVKKPCIGQTQTQKASTVLTKKENKFSPVSSPAKFDEIEEIVQDSASHLVCVVGPVGCGKSHGIAKLIERNKIFTPSALTPTDTDLYEKLVIACRKDANLKRIVVVEDVDGFTEHALAQLYRFLKDTWKPNVYCTIFFTLPSWKNALTSALKSMCKTIYIAAPTELELVCFGKSMVSDKKIRPTNSQLERFAASASGDIRRFGMLVNGFASSYSDETTNAFEAVEAILDTRRGYEKTLTIVEKTDVVFVNRLLHNNALFATSNIDILASMFESTSFFETMSLPVRLVQNDAALALTAKVAAGAAVGGGAAGEGGGGAKVCLFAKAKMYNRPAASSLRVDAFRALQATQTISQ